MVTYFNKKDLIAFGNFLVSKERKERLKQITHPMDLPDRLAQVSDADVANWIDKQKTKQDGN